MYNTYETIGIKGNTYNALEAVNSVGGVEISLSKKEVFQRLVSLSRPFLRRLMRLKKGREVVGGVNDKATTIKKDEGAQYDSSAGKDQCELPF